MKNDPPKRLKGEAEARAKKLLLHIKSLDPKKSSEVLIWVRKII